MDYGLNRMRKQSSVIVVLVTCPNKAVAGKLAETLVSQKLAACVNIVSAVRSVFWWQGKLERCSEALLFIKTQKSRFEALKQAILKKHPYDNPEIIALPVIAGYPPYLSWVRDSVS